MDTAQLLLTKGSQTQQLQAVTKTVPWIALAVVAGVVAWIFMRRKR